MNNESLVSIITPLYNCEEYIGETIESVINQTYQNWEMIIVDDCSTDKSRNIAEEYAQKEKRLKIYKLEKNSGPSVARNKAIEEAKGEYLAFLDSDDLWFKSKLEEQIRFMKEENIYFCYSYYYSMNKYNQKKCIISKDMVNYNDMLKKNYIGNSTVVINIEELGKCYVPNIRKRNDYALWLKVLREKTPEAICYKKPTMIYIIRKGSISSKKLNLIKYNYKLFKEEEGFSFFKSLFYTLNNVIRKFID